MTGILSFNKSFEMRNLDVKGDENNSILVNKDFLRLVCGVVDAHSSWTLYLKQQVIITRKVQKGYEVLAVVKSKPFPSVSAVI